MAALLGVVALTMALLALPAGPALAQESTPTPPPVSGGPPPIPAEYNGTVLVGGQAPPDGITFVARIGTVYESSPVTVTAGQFLGLDIAPLDGALVGSPVTFHLGGTVQADQSIRFSPLFEAGHLDLTFPSLPEPTVTPTPEPTEIPTATPTVAAALPAVYSGNIVVAGGHVPAGATLVARIGSYESPPAEIQGDSYSNLVIAPNDTALLGQAIVFALAGVESETSEIYESGKINQALTLVFVGLPTPTPTPVPPTATPVPPTATPVPPTATPVPPTATPVPPTATPVPPTATPVPPTATPVPPTATPVPPTATPVPPTATPVPPTATPVPPTATPVPPTATPVPPAPTAVPTAAPTATPVPESSGGMGTLILILALVVVLAAAGGVGAYLVMSRRNQY